MAHKMVKYTHKIKSQSSVTACGCVNSTIKALYSHYDPNYVAKKTDFKVPKIDKSLEAWLAEGEGSVEEIKSTYLYEVVKTEYFKNLKESYMGVRGCASSFMGRYKITEVEFDDRMILSVTAALSMIGHFTYAMGFCEARLPDFTALSRSLWRYVSLHCTSSISTGSTTNLHYWYNSWIMNLLATMILPAAWENSFKESLSDIHMRVFNLFEAFTCAFAIAFEHPEEIPFMFYVCRYYMQPFTVPCKTYHCSVAFFTFLALVARKVGSKPTERLTLEDVDSKIGNTFRMDMSFEYLKMPQLCRKLPSIYGKLFAKPDKVANVLLLGADNYSVQDCYKIILGDSSVLDVYNFIYTRLESIFDRNYFAGLALGPQYARVTWWRDTVLASADNAEIQNILSRNALSNSYLRCSEHYEVTVGIQDVLNSFRSESTLTLRDSYAELETLYVKARADLKANRNYKADYDAAMRDMSRVNSTLVKQRVKLEREKETNDALRKELSAVKMELEHREDTSALKARIADLENALQKEKSQNSALRNRVSNLEHRGAKEQQLKAEVDNLKAELSDANKLNSLLMDEAPEDDNRELTPEELNILHVMNAHLVVPDMTSMHELQKLMPKSEFWYTSRESDITLNVSKGSDIFFFCLKFCSHGGYWRWKKSLKNSSERCVAAYTAGKNNVARLLITKYKELHG